MEGDTINISVQANVINETEYDINHRSLPKKDCTCDCEVTVDQRTCWSNQQRSELLANLLCC